MNATIAATVTFLTGFTFAATAGAAPPDGLPLWLRYPAVSPENRPIYENQWRKGAVSDGAHDVWLYDTATHSHRQRTQLRGEDRDPVWATDGGSFFCLSERSGSFNIWRSSLEGDAKPEPITDHTQGAVRFLSIARDGTLVYGLEGEVWRRIPGQPSQRVEISMRQGTVTNETFNVTGDGQFSEMKLSRDGSQLAVVARGEIFVFSAASQTTRRITHTPVHERNVDFAPDGRSLVYISERDGDMDIFHAALGDAAMKDFASQGPPARSHCLRPPEKPGGPLIPPLPPHLEGKPCTTQQNSANTSRIEGARWLGQRFWLFRRYANFGRWSVTSHKRRGRGRGRGRQSVPIRTLRRCAARWILGTGVGVPAGEPESTG